MVIPNRVSFLQACISRLDKISARNTWESIQLFSVTSRLVSLQTFQTTCLFIAESHWRVLRPNFSNFKRLVCVPPTTGKRSTLPIQNRICPHRAPPLLVPSRHHPMHSTISALLRVLAQALVLVPWAETMAIKADESSCCWL